MTVIPMGSGRLYLSLRRLKIQSIIGGASVNTIHLRNDGMNTLPSHRNYVHSAVRPNCRLWLEYSFPHILDFTLFESSGVSGMRVAVIQ
jgi:hypothetical protein